MNLLNKVNSPKDIKGMSIEELKTLAQEIREVLITRVTETGGHMAPNLGFVEATLALHYVFDSPKDKFVFDVSHQSYIHKMLTGRKEGFTDPASYSKYSGYTNPNESDHDFFTVGHTSTSVSLASGLAKARDLKGEDGNVIAIIGDGSMSGGEALEGLNVVLHWAATSSYCLTITICPSLRTKAVSTHTSKPCATAKAKRKTTSSKLWGLTMYS